MSTEIPRVLLICGSPSDLDLVLDTRDVLDSLEIQGEIRVLSAHRTPDEAAACARGAEREGFSVVVAFAGMSAALAGVVAAHTQLPVIGVPVSGGALGGVDAALSTLQMPPGTPVASVAIDGARNAGLLAARILGNAHPDIRDRLQQRTEKDRERYRPERVEAEIERRLQSRKPRS